MEIIAHRGASFDAPENTLAAVNLAWQQGADAVEFDIHLTKDGRLVALHDDSTGRTAGLDRPVAEQTLAELQQLDVGQWKDARFVGEPIPTLEALLATVPSGKRVFVEVKCGPGGGCGAGARGSSQRVASRTGGGGQFLTCGLCRRQAGPATTCGLSARQLQTRRKIRRLVPPPWKSLIAAAQRDGLDGLDLNFHRVDSAVVNQLKAAGLRIYVWTVDDPVIARWMIDAGVEGLTTNRPVYLREVIYQP